MSAKRCERCGGEGKLLVRLDDGARVLLCLACQSLLYRFDMRPTGPPRVAVAGPSARMAPQFVGGKLTWIVRPGYGRWDMDDEWRS
jgi:hypothetical protein